VIYEFPDGNGFDLLAAYADGTLRYYGHRAGGFVLQHPAAPVGKAVDSVLAAGRTLVLGVGPWSKPDLPPLPEGHLRVSMVAPSGIHFGMGPAADLAADAQAKPAVAAGFALLERVVALVARR